MKEKSVVLWISENKLLILQIIIVMVVFSSIAWTVEKEGYGLRLNRSTSLPFVVFFSKKIESLEKGKYVAFTHPKTGLTLAKQIVGIPGDFIQIQNQHAFINGQDYGIIKTVSPSGTLITPIAEGCIPKNYLFVHAPHENSFDSRYSEFGLVNIDWLQEELWPIY